MVGIAIAYPESAVESASRMPRGLPLSCDFTVS